MNYDEVMCSSAVEILPHLWLGNIKASRNREFLHQYKINCIVNCTKNFDFDADAMLAETKKIRIAVSDTGTPEANQDLLVLLDRGVTYIHRQLTRGDHVLVHCYAGKQRSPAVIAAFLMKYCRLSVQKTLSIISERWQQAYPDHYLPALKTFAGGEFSGQCAVCGQDVTSLTCWRCPSCGKMFCDLNHDVCRCA
jgi:hypothetical protein